MYIKRGEGARRVWIYGNNRHVHTDQQHRWSMPQVSLKELPHIHPKIRGSNRGARRSSYVHFLIFFLPHRRGAFIEIEHPSFCLQNKSNIELLNNKKRCPTAWDSASCFSQLLVCFSIKGKSIKPHKPCLFSTSPNLSFVYLPQRWRHNLSHVNLANWPDCPRPLEFDYAHN